MLDVREAFSKAAGEDVTYLRHEIRGRRLAVYYVISGIAHSFIQLVSLMNNSNVEVEAKARVCGTLAGQRAFRNTGKYDRQMQRLREGRLS